MSCFFLPLCPSFLSRLPPFCWKDDKAKRAPQTSHACFEERMKMRGCCACKLPQRETAQAGCRIQCHVCCIPFPPREVLRANPTPTAARIWLVFGCHEQGRRFSSWNGPCPDFFVSPFLSTPPVSLINPKSGLSFCEHFLSFLKVPTIK